MNNDELKHYLLNSDIDMSELDKLSDSERKVLIDMVNELQFTGSSDTLKSLWYEDYNEVPVDIDTFIDDPNYLGNALGNTIYPFWRDQLRNIFAPGAKYYEIVFTGSIGIGKSTIADVGMAYILYKLLCMKNPQSYYGLTKSSVMTMNFFNVNLNLSYGVAYSKLQSMLLSSPWFLDHGSIVGIKNEVYIPNNNIQMVVGSQEEHALGQDVFCLTGNTKLVTSEGIVSLSDASGKSVTVLQINKFGNLELSDRCFVNLTKYTDELVRVTLEDNSVIEGTPNHRMMMIDGTYKELQDIQVGDDLFDMEVLNK